MDRDLSQASIEELTDLLNDPLDAEELELVQSELEVARAELTVSEAVDIIAGRLELEEDQRGWGDPVADAQLRTLEAALARIELVLSAAAKLDQAYTAGTYHHEDILARLEKLHSARAGLDGRTWR